MTQKHMFDLNACTSISAHNKFCLSRSSALKLKGSSGLDCVAKVASTLLHTAHVQPSNETSDTKKQKPNKTAKLTSITYAKIFRTLVDDSCPVDKNKKNTHPVTLIY